MARPSRNVSRAEYHARLNTRVAEHIRQRWPKKTIGVNSWGTEFGDVSAKDAIVKLSRTVGKLLSDRATSWRQQS